MGLFGLFKHDKHLSDKQIEKSVKLATNPFAQPDVRMREMQRLLNDASDASYRAVVKRFAANSNGLIADEDEKRWLEDALVEEGPDALPALRDFIRQEQKITYALRTYERIAGKADAYAVFLQILAKHGPDSYRTSEAKLQIIWHISESIDDERVMQGILPFVHDHSDEVRWAVLDILEKTTQKGPMAADMVEEGARLLGQVLFEESASLRIRRRVADLLASFEWSVPGEATELPSDLADSFFVDKKRYLRRRVSK